MAERTEKFRAMWVAKTIGLVCCSVIICSSPRAFFQLPLFWLFALSTAAMWLGDTTWWNRSVLSSSRNGKTARLALFLVCLVFVATWITTAWKPMIFFGHSSVLYIGNSRLEYSILLGNRAASVRLLRALIPSYRTGGRMRGYGWPTLFWVRGLRPIHRSSVDAANAIETHVFLLPFWLIFAAVGVPALITLAQVLRRSVWKPLGAHQCQHCEYDLTGNTSGICPECGTPIPKDLITKLEPATAPPER